MTQRVPASTSTMTRSRHARTSLARPIASNNRRSSRRSVIVAGAGRSERFQVYCRSHGLDEATRASAFQTVQSATTVILKTLQVAEKRLRRRNTCELPYQAVPGVEFKDGLRTNGNAQEAVA